MKPKPLVGQKHYDRKKISDYWNCSESNYVGYIVKNL